MSDGRSGGGNSAEASSSRRVASTSGKRGRNQNRGRESKDTDDKSPTLPVSLSPRPDGLSTRRVRTVPPSARYEPPSPPSPVNSPLPNSPPKANTQRSKQRRRLRYSSSESSSDDESDSDDEPPWWTFTQRGMMRLRARNLHDGALTEGESGKESGKEKLTKSENRTSGMFSSSRRSSKDNKERPGSSKSNKIKKRDSGGESPSKAGSTSTLNAKLLQPAPIRLTSTQSFFRRSHSRPDGVHASASTPSIVFIPPVRPSSAPTSPILDAPSPGLTTLVDGTSSRFPSDEGPPPSISDLGTLQHPIPKRQLTTPAFPRFFKRDFINDEPMESLTDTETVPSARAKVAKSKSASIPPPLPRIITEDPNGNSTSTPDGTSTPTRPKTRQRPSHRLRINLPPPITHHFSHGWPHAGSWQDALNGSYFDDGMDATAMRPSRSRRSTKLNDETNGESAAPATPTTRTRPQSLLQEQMGQHEDIPEEQEATTKRSKSKRARRYRQALVPPTPSGLGFTPRTRTSGPDEYPWTEGHDPESGFDWQNGTKNVVPQQIPGRTESPSPNMSHADTLDTAHTEKTESDRGAGTKRRWGLFRRRPKPRGSMVDSDWRRRYRRILFLDARVTIWIRLVNLAVVLALLALAVKIRLGLITLQLPGVIGSSTTLIIAYSSFTMVHVLTAIYREYFGKPIGLWGLRSKMLWVCLDLLFVALWSSAMSLAINDLIATPLDCTPSGAWWRVDLAEGYAELLQSLANTTSSTSTSSAISSKPTVVVTSVSGITKTLGITLPSSVLSSSLTHHVCREQQGCIALSLLALLLYGGNMVLSLFRIFETVRRTAGANPSKAIPV